MPEYGGAVPRRTAEKLGEQPSLLDYDSSLERSGAKVISDAAMSSGSSTLTSATAQFTTKDTGKRFVIVGALGSNVDPLIATGTYVSANQMSLSVAASVTVSAATCTYGQNARTAIVAGLASVALNGAGSLLIPAGIWLVWGGTLDFFSSGTTVYGLGRSSVLYAADYTDSGFFADSLDRISIRDLSFRSHAKTRGQRSATGAAWLVDCTNISLRNLYIDGGKSAGVYVDACIGGEVANIEVQSTLADGVHIVGGSKRIRVSGVHGYRTGDDTVSVVSYASQPQCEDIHVSNCTSIDTVNGRCFSSIGSKDVVFDGFKAINPGSHGLICAYESEILDGPTVIRAETHVPSGCRFLNGVVERVDAAPGFNALIVTGEDSGHVVDDVEINNVTFKASNQSLISFASNVRVTGCTIRNGIYNGIKVTNSEDVDISSNRFKVIDEAGIVFDAVTGGRVDNNDLTECQSTTGNASTGRVQVVNSADVIGSGNRDKRTAALASYGPLLSSSNARVHIEVTEIDTDGTANYKLKGNQYNSATKQLLIETDRPVNDSEYGLVVDKGAYFHNGDVQIEGTAKKLLGSGGAAWLMLASGFPRLSSPGGMSMEMNSGGAASGFTFAVKNNGTIILNITASGDIYAAGKLYLGNLSTSFIQHGSGAPGAGVAPGAIYIDKDGPLDQMLYIGSPGPSPAWVPVRISAELPNDGSVGMSLQLTATGPRAYGFRKVDMGVAAQVQFTGGVTDRPVKKGVNGELWTDTINLQAASDIRMPGVPDGAVLANAGGVVSYFTIDGLGSNLLGSASFLAGLRAALTHTHNYSQADGRTGTAAPNGHDHSVGSSTVNTGSPNW